MVNKADGALAKAAGDAAAEYQNALHLMRPRVSWWKGEVLMASALQGIGLPDIWRRVQEFQKKLEAQSDPQYNRAAQARRWLWEEIQDDFTAAIKSDSNITPVIAAREEQEAGRKLRRPPPRGKF